MKIVLVLMCFEAAYLQKSDPLKISKSDINFFHKVNSNSHTTMNKLLTAIQLNKSFTKSAKTNMLLKIHFYLNKMAQRNYRAYEQLINISGAVARSHKNNLVELLQQSVDEEIEIFQNNITNTSITVEPHFNNNKTEYNSIENLLNNMNELWLDISDLTMENMIDPIINEAETSKYSFTTKLLNG